MHFTHKIDRYPNENNPRKFTNITAAQFSRELEWAYRKLLKEHCTHIVLVVYDNDTTVFQYLINTFDTILEKGYIVNGNKQLAIKIPYSVSNFKKMRQLFKPTDCSPFLTGKIRLILSFLNKSML